MALLWINDLSGSQNQHSSPGLLANNQGELMVNVSQLIDGTWSHRLGTQLKGNALPNGNQVRGLHMYEKNNGNLYFHMVYNGNIYRLDGDVWNVQQVSAFNANSNIDFANFAGQHYMASDTPGENVTYIDNTAAKANMLATDGTQIEGKYLANNGAFMLISGGATNPLYSYWTNVGVGTVTKATDFAITSAPPTGNAAFGNGRPFIIFTQDNYLIVDPATNYTNQVEGFGCCSHRSIQNVRGALIWLDREGFYMMGSNDAYPIEISLPIKNDQTGDAIFDQISSGNFTVAAAGSIDSRYYCAVGDLEAQVKGVTINSAIFEFDVAQQSWRTHTFESNDIGAVFANFIDDTGRRKLYSGSKLGGAVFEMEVKGKFTDDDIDGEPQAVTATVITKNHEILRESDAQPTTVKKWDEVHFKYRTDTAITVGYDVSSEGTYTNFTNTLPTTGNKKWDWRYFMLGKDNQSCGLKISGAGDWTIYAYGLRANTNRTQNTKPL